MSTEKKFPALATHKPEATTHKRFPKLATHPPEIIVDPPEEKADKPAASKLASAAKVVALLVTFLLLCCNAIAQYGPGLIGGGTASYTTNAPSINTNAPPPPGTFTNPPAGPVYYVVQTDTNGNVVWPSFFRGNSNALTQLSYVVNPIITNYTIGAGDLSVLAKTNELFDVATSTNIFITLPTVSASSPDIFIRNAGTGTNIVLAAAGNVFDTAIAGNASLSVGGITNKYFGKTIGLRAGSRLTNWVAFTTEKPPQNIVDDVVGSGALIPAGFTPTNISSATQNGFTSSNQWATFGIPNATVRAASPTPYMGFNTYYYPQDRPTVSGFWPLFFGAITNMAQNGYVANGYNILVMDSGWWLTNASGVVRDANGCLMLATNNLVAPYLTTITNIVPLVKYLAGYGIKLGLYYEPTAVSLDGWPSGNNTNIELDAQWFATNGVAYVKFDGVTPLGTMSDKAYYTERFAQALSYYHSPVILDVGFPTTPPDNFTPPPAVFDSVTCWRMAYGPSGAWGYDVGGVESEQWNEFLHAVDQITPQMYLRQYGHYPSAESVPVRINQPAMMREALAAYAVMGIPLEPVLPSAPGDQNYAITMSYETNQDLIAINQDMAAPPELVFTNGFTTQWANATGGIFGPTNANAWGQQIIVRPVGGQAFNSCKFIAAALMNRTPYYATTAASTNITLNFWQLGLGSNAVCYVYDVFNKTNCFVTNSFTAAVPTNDVYFAKIYPISPNTLSAPPVTIPATTSQTLYAPDFAPLSATSLATPNAQAPYYFGQALNIPTSGAWYFDSEKFSTIATQAVVTAIWYWPGTGTLSFTNQVKSRTSGRLGVNGIEDWTITNVVVLLTNYVTPSTFLVNWEGGRHLPTMPRDIYSLPT